MIVVEGDSGCSSDSGSGCFRLGLFRGVFLWRTTILPEDDDDDDDDSDDVVVRVALKRRFGRIAMMKDE
jgi:hypothetical protein